MASSARAWALDADSDTFPSAQDCNDHNSAINQNAQEVIANTVDEDCDHEDTINRVSQLIDPASHMYNIADIAPSPFVTDTLLVVPQIDASAWFECNEYPDNTASSPVSLGCPDVPAPYILERPVTTWTEVTFGELPPSLVGTAGSWSPKGDYGPTILYATEGASAWQGVMSW